MQLILKISSRLILVNLKMLKEKKNYEAEAELVVGEETQGAIGRLSQ
jgi:hypothetical protein